MDFRICQTSTASPAKPGGLPLTLERNVALRMPNEQDFIRRAAAWRIRSVELNRWIQAQAVGK